MDVAGHRPQPDLVGPHDRPRPRIVKAGGEQEVQATNRRRLLDGANSDLSPISVGGCSVTNYNVGVTVGDQGVVVILDSGSGDLAVASTACGKSCEGIPDLWNTDQSGSTGQQGSLSYGSAQVVGDVFQESVTLPGEPAVTMNMLAITDQASSVMSALMHRTERCLLLSLPAPQCDAWRRLPCALLVADRGDCHACCACWLELAHWSAL